MRKLWLFVALGLGMAMSFLALLVVGTYTAASGLAGRGVGLAKGAVPSTYQALVQEWGNLCPALNPALLAAQLYQESGWDPNAVSPADARGIAQFMPGTWATHGIDANGDGERDINDPEDAIPSAATYDCKLAGYVEDVPGDPTENMLAAYNAGPYAVIKYNGVPPYRDAELRPDHQRPGAELRRPHLPPLAVEAGRRRHPLRAGEAGHALSVGR